MISKAVHDALLAPPRGETDQFADLYEDLRSFVANEQVTPMQIKGLSDGDCGVWELKSFEIEPPMRVLGCFAEKSTFIGLSLKYRVDLDGTWDSAISEVLEKWRTLFHPSERLKTRLIRKLFTGATDADEKYFRY